MKRIDKRITRSFVRQHDESDCGVACLAMIIRYYGGDAQLELLRDLSGTETQGTTLLGLYQAAGRIGLEADGYKADIDALKGVHDPSILHIIKDGILQHYIVCFGYVDGEFIIADPGDGLTRYSEERLAEEWVSGALLLAKPNESFVTTDRDLTDRRRWIRYLVRDDLTVLGLALALGVITALLALSVAIFSQKLIDEILPSGDSARLVQGIWLLGLLLLVKAGLGAVRRLFLTAQTRDFNNRIIEYFYDSLLRLPKSFFDHRKVGTLVARMNDTERIQRAITFVVGGMMIDALSVIVAVVVMFTYSTLLGLLSALSLPLYFLVTKLYHDKIVQSQKRVMGGYAATEGNYVDTIGGIATIKASNKETLFSTTTKTVYGIFQGSIYDLGRVGVSFNLWTEVIGVVSLVAIIAVSSFMVLESGLMLGEMMAVVQIIGMLIPSAGRLAVTNIQLQEARVALERMFEFTLLKPEYEPEQEAAKPSLDRFNHLHVDRVSFRFPGRKPLLTDVSFSIFRGEFIALFGESGCGKTTMLQILQKFYHPDAGTILVNNEQWEDVSIPGWRGLIGVAPQTVKIFNGTLLANIALADGDECAEKVVEFCRAMGFDRYFTRFPQGYMTMLGEGGINLSGGQQQLVSLARTLYRKPQLLLLDEATSALDRDTETFVMELIESLRGTIGIVMVTHRPQTAKRADRIYVLEQGSVRADGDHRRLLDHGDNLYARAWRDLVADPVPAELRIS